MANNKATVATPCPQRIEMDKHVELPLALMGGTLEMKEGDYALKYLPREPKETLAAWSNRLARTVLYGAYKRTVQSLSGLPFHRAANITGEHKDLSYLIEDCDNDDSDITDFSHQLLQDILVHGLSHFIVDNPDVGSAVTLGDKAKYKVRPYFSHISPSNIIAWTSEQIGGTTVLTSIRIKEEAVIPDGEWGFREVDQIRVLTQTETTLYQEESRGKWVIVGAPIPNNLGKIPLVTVYGEKTGYLTASPPLEDLAWLNLRHYQKLSDLDNIEHVANVPILLATGVSDTEIEGISVGPSTLTAFSDKDANLRYVEHSGSAIGASQLSLSKTEEQMASMGADLIIRKSVDRQTATARKLDSSESVSILQIFINNVETGISKGFAIAGEWIDKKSDGVVVSIGSWLDSGADGPNTIDLLMQLLIDNKAFTVDEAIKELQRRGVLSDTFKKGEEVSETLIVEPVVDVPADVDVEIPASPEAPQTSE
jgi:hypothetical protein